MAEAGTKWKKRLGTATYVVVTLLVCMVVLEFGARWMGLGNPILYYNSAQGGLRPLPDQQVTRLGGARVTVDENGFRTQTVAGDSAFRVLFLGDSVTWGGSSVDDSLIFSERSARLLAGASGPGTMGRQIYAMNAGVNSTGLLNQAGVYRETQGRIDAIVWLFPSGDLYRSFASAGYLWPPTRKPRFALVEVVDKVIQLMWLPRFRQETVAGTRRYTRASVPQGHEAFFESVFEERFAANAEAFESVLIDARARGIPVIAGVTPEYVDGTIAPTPEEATRIMAAADSLGAVVLDLRGPFRDAENPASLYLDTVHFAVPGHELVGQHVADALFALTGPGKED